MQTLYAHVADNGIGHTVVVTVDEELQRQLEAHLRRPLRHGMVRLGGIGRHALLIDHTIDVGVPVPPLGDGDGKVHAHRVGVHHGHVEPRQTYHARVDLVGECHLLDGILQSVYAQRNAVLVCDDGRQRVGLIICGVEQRVTYLVGVVRYLHAVGRKVPESRA